MRALTILILALSLASQLCAEAPIYSSESIVNAADNQPGPLAPNTIASIYGNNLAWGTRAVTADDIRGGRLPTVFSGTGTQVIIGGIRAGLYYVSPTQINFLVPANLLPGTVYLNVKVDSFAGPSVPIRLADCSPALFQLDLDNAVATRPDGSVVTPDSPARPGEIVVLYATGLGQTMPPIPSGQLASHAASLARIAEFSVTIDGLSVDSSSIAYAGVTPGFAGLYQINLILPDSTPANPKIQIGLTDSLSPPGVRLPVQPW